MKKCINTQESTKRHTRTNNSNSDYVHRMVGFTHLQQAADGSVGSVLG